jgi:hypothetical protein
MAQTKPLVEVSEDLRPAPDPARAFICAWNDPDFPDSSFEALVLPNAKFRQGDEKAVDRSAIADYIRKWRSEHRGDWLTWRETSGDTFRMAHRHPDTVQEELWDGKVELDSTQRIAAISLEPQHRQTSVTR